LGYNEIAESLASNFVVCLNKRYINKLASPNLLKAFLIMTLLHEMAHIKIGYFYNNKCFYKRTPDKICDRNIKECGF